jgi:hypothetical protein
MVRALSGMVMGDTGVGIARVEEGCLTGSTLTGVGRGRDSSEMLVALGVREGSGVEVDGMKSIGVAVGDLGMAVALTNMAVGVVMSSSARCVGEGEYVLVGNDERGEGLLNA